MDVSFRVSSRGLAILLELKLNALAKADLYFFGSTLEQTYKDAIISITTRGDTEQDFRALRFFLALFGLISGVKYCNFRITQVYVFGALEKYDRVSTHHWKVAL